MTVVRWYAAVLLVCGLVGTRPAAAKEQFPGIVQDALDVDCPPPCTLCHTSIVPSLDNAAQPFVENLRKLALAQGSFINANTLPGLLKDLRTEECHRDGDPSCDADPTRCGPCDADGQNDVDIVDIEKGRNPNDSSLLACPKYGCGAARLAPARRGGTFDGSVALIALAGLGAFLRRRSNTRR